MIGEHPIQDFLANADRRVVALVLGSALAVVSALIGVSLAFIGPIYTLGVLIALAGGVWMFAGVRNAMISIVLIIALLPYATLPFEIILTPTFLDIAMGAFFFLYIGEWMTGYRRRLIVTPVHALIVMFMLLGLLSFVAGLANAPLTPTILRQFAEMLLSITFAMVLVDVLRTTDDLKMVIRVLLVAGAMGGLAAVVLWLLPDSLTENMLARLAVIGYPDSGIIQYVEANPDLPERAIGLWANPNSLGGFLVMAAALMAPQAMAEKPLVGKRSYALAMLGVLVLALVLTFSRGSMLAFAAALVFIAALRYPRLLLLLIVIAALILVLPWTQFYVQRLVEGFQGADLATQMRFGEYRDALTLVSRYPLLGVGFTGTPDVDIYLGVANVYLTIASNMGLLGLSAFLVLMLAVFAMAWSARYAVKLHEDLDPILLGLTAGLVGALVNGLFDHYFFNIGFHPAVTILWTFVGLTLATASIARRAEAEAGFAQPLDEKSL
ncbi:MAG TPA: O-antigen ligase family protein [Aggregatilineales bacterium]|nr:O-antigen ligase family protein [Aggregatilineales bacterium]HQA69092.1 O-antigen ligase family protein [Aggregatilineales bacterium]HQE19453.1 O-antigen ligase family protein [Aggregatilineales bacterium]